MFCWHRDSEEDKVVYPFYSWLDLMVLQDSKCCIRNVALNASSCGQTFDGHMLHVNCTLPENAEVFLVMGDDGRVSISLLNIKRCSLSPSRTRGHLGTNM